MNHLPGLARLASLEFSCPAGHWGSRTALQLGPQVGADVRRSRAVRVAAPARSRGGGEGDSSAPLVSTKNYSPKDGRPV